MRNFIAVISILFCLSNCTQPEKPINIKNYYGDWVNDSLINHMYSSKSPYLSRRYVYNSLRLELNDSTILQYFDEAIVAYRVNVSSNNTIILATDRPGDSSELKIINDTTMILVNEPFSRKNITLRKFKYYTSDFKECFNENIFLHFIKNKYFRGKKDVISVQNQDQHFVIDFSSGCNVKGFFNFSNYGIFIGGMENTPGMDIIRFETADGIIQYFNYVIYSDSIKLYQFADKLNSSNNMISDSLSFGLVRGKLIYILANDRNK